MGVHPGQVAPPPIVTRRGKAMGGSWSLRQPVGDRDATNWVQAALNTVEAQMSAWRPDSALCRLNRARLGEWVPVPAEMMHVLRAGLDLMRIAPKAFSVLLGGPSVRAGFQPGCACGHGSDPDMIELDAGAARRMADVAVDLNAIAKGFAADLAASLLRDEGINHFLIEVAGDIVAQGTRPDGLPWTAAFELPIPGRSVPAGLIPLYDAGLACSGGYRRFQDGGCHILDPVTGVPLAATNSSVAVLAPGAMLADGWATTLAVLGREAGLALAARHGLPALFLSPAPDGQGFLETGSPAMAELMQIGEQPFPDRRA